MTITYDKEANFLFGLTVAFIDAEKGWCVKQHNGPIVEVCGQYEDATHRRAAIVDDFVSRVDQITADFFTKNDRIFALEQEIVRNFGPIDTGHGHRRDLIVLEVETDGFTYRGEAYDDREAALQSLLAALEAGRPCRVEVVRGADLGDVPAMAAE